MSCQRNSHSTCILKFEVHPHPPAAAKGGEILLVEIGVCSPVPLAASLTLSASTSFHGGKQEFPLGSAVPIQGAR